MTKQRTIRELLVERHLARDRKEAEALVLAGRVLANDQRVEKPGAKISVEVELRIKGDVSKFVSRAGDKLEGAINDFRLSHEFKNAVVLDVGSSTGGFTDCVLQHGASRVYAVDVGTNQLAWKLRNDDRVIVSEKTDIKDFKPNTQILFDFILCDVSFTSLSFIAPALLHLGTHSTRYLLLIKPQFEAKRELVSEGGIIRDEIQRLEIIQKTKDDLEKAGFTVMGNLDSRLKGRSGNLESWILCKKRA